MHAPLASAARRAGHLATRIVPLFLVLAGLLAAAPSRACVTAEAGSNNSESQANGPLCSGVALSGAINNNSDVDWFTFDVDAAGTIVIALDHSSRDDFDWALYAASGPAVAVGESSRVPEDGSYAAPSAGVYFLKITRYRGRGWYTLDVTFPEGGGAPGTACAYGPRPSVPGGLSRWLTGSNADECPSLSDGPGLLLMGGGSDVDQAFSQRVAPVIDGGDVVVLRTTGSNGYNGYLFNLMGADSVETLRLDSRSRADSSYADWVIRSAEFVFIAGGDQAEYLNLWQGTATQDALQHVHDKGGVIGGTSAGLAVLGNWIYDPDGIPGIFSDEAVTDPCHPYMNISGRFLDLPWLDDVITDTHFEARDRMGRLLTFMARIRQPGLAPTANPILGIGVDEGTAMYIDDAGLGRVDGSGTVYVLRESGATTRQRVQCGSAVEYYDVNRYALRAGDTYNWSTGAASRAPLPIGVDGRAGAFYSPSDPY